MPGAPSPEQCNGVDDDCDGTVDDMPGDVGEPCSAGTGACQRMGVTVCRDGHEVCGAQAGNGQDEACNNMDDDCDGQIDEDVTRPCGNATGACRQGTQTCAAGQWGQCMGAVGPVDETCNGTDDDCDGQTDEDLTRACDGGPGTCGMGQQQCTNGHWGECEGAPRAQPEVCNGEDDDCDGHVDEDPTDVGQPCDVGMGTCAASGHWRCVDGERTCDAMPGMPGNEVCDGRDNNCDGRVDETFADCMPRGNACVDGLCKCGGNAQCAAGETCNNGVCIH
jgi:hypothetical protein